MFVPSYLSNYKTEIYKYLYDFIKVNIFDNSSRLSLKTFKNLHFLDILSRD